MVITTVKISQKWIGQYLLNKEVQQKPSEPMG